MKRRGFITGLCAAAVTPFLPKFRTPENKIINMYGSIGLPIYKPFVRRRNWEGTNVQRIAPGKIIEIAENQGLIEELNRQGKKIDYDEFIKAMTEMFDLEKGIQQTAGKCEWPKSS